MDDTLTKIRKILEDCGAWSNDAAWQVPKSNAWCIKHKALEIVAAHKGITFDAPVIYEGNGLERVSMLVTGRMGERSEWSVGECSTQNYKAFGNPKMAAYPWAMAEKRGKDRVILKLIGLHGYAYSEDEADDFKAPPADPRFITEEQEAEISALMARAGADAAAFLKYLGIGSLSELPLANYENAKKALLKKIEKMQEAA